MLPSQWFVEGGVSRELSVSIPSQFDTHYKMVLILTLGLILILLAGAGRIHADDHTKRQIQYIIGLKLLKGQRQNVANNHAKTNIWSTMAAY